MSIMSVFLNWIDINKLDMRIISGHPEAVPFFEANPHLICWDEFSANSAAITFLTANLDKVNWVYLSRNSAGFQLLLANKDKIDWDALGYNMAENTYLLYEDNIDKITNWMPICKNESAWINKVLDGNIEKLNNIEIIELSSNPAAIPVIEKYLHLMIKYGLVMNPYVQDGIYDANTLFAYIGNRIPINYCSYAGFVTFLRHNRDKIDKYICMNTNPYAEELIEQYLEKEDMDKIDYPNEPYWLPLLSANPAAVQCMKKYIKYIYWSNFSGLEEAIDIIRENIDMVDWNALSGNRLAMNILEMNQNKINWENMSHNIGIYIDQTRANSENKNKKNKFECKCQQQEQLYNKGTIMPIVDFEKITIHYEENLGPLYYSDSDSSDSDSSDSI
jgi:hypothetical protein